MDVESSEESGDEDEEFEDQPKPASNKQAKSTGIFSLFK
jgi:hypothetical protein